MLGSRVYSRWVYDFRLTDSDSRAESGAGERVGRFGRSTGKGTEMFEVSYNCRGDFSKSYSSGSRRFADSAAILEWMQFLLKNGDPLLITEIRNLNERT